MSGLAGRRIALIGGAGFIGHHLALSLVQAGADVHAVDGLQVNNFLALASTNPTPQRDFQLRILHERLDLLRSEGVHLHVQDAREYHGIHRVLSDIAPDVIVHAAAVAHADRSNKDPYGTFDHNLRSLASALDWTRGRRAHFVFLSSSMVYGNFLSAEVDEQHPLNPIGIYGAIKLSGEKLLIGYHQVFDIPYTIVRP